MEYLKTSSYKGGEVIFLDFQGYADDDDRGNKQVKVRHDGVDKIWSLKATDSRLDFLPKTPGQRFRLVMKDTGNRFAYAAVEKLDTQTPIKEVVKQQETQEKRIDDTQDRITRGLCLNVASRQIKGKPQEVIVYAMELYEEYNKWNNGNM